VLSDTLQANTNLRSSLLGRKKGRHIVYESDDYFESFQFHPETIDTIGFPLHKVVYSKDQHFTLHFLLLYQNIHGALYDIYCWADFDANNLEGRLYFRKDSTGLSALMKYAKKDLASLLRLRHPISHEEYAYSYKEAIKVDETLRELGPPTRRFTMRRKFGGG
jgi:hypothetical protein